MVKGITHPDDARRALDIGATKIGVFNHGGNNLDTTPASVRFLRGIVDAVAGRAQIPSTAECAAAPMSSRPWPWVRTSHS